METRKPIVLLVEDETYVRQEFTKLLEGEGYDVLACPEPNEALLKIEAADAIDFAIMDMQMPIEKCPWMSLAQSGGGRYAGLAFARRFRKKFPLTPIVFWSNLYERDLREKITRVGHAQLIPKRSGSDPVIDAIAEGVEGISNGTRPRTFIVHGHDETVVKDLVTLLTDEFKFPNPTVLWQSPSFLTTVIEKLERESQNVDLVFVLLTPDDHVVPSGQSEPVFRPRQNVIFELGFFLGLIGRDMGRVIVLFKEPIELPSDIGGVIKINITNGMASAKDEIQREVREWLR